jgi:hypothetical protein
MQQANFLIVSLRPVIHEYGLGPAGLRFAQARRDSTEVRASGESVVGQPLTSKSTLHKRGRQNGQEIVQIRTAGYEAAVQSL